MSETFIEVFFDIETKKFFDEIDSRDPAGLGISVISVYKREVDGSGKEIKGEMKSFWDPIGEPNRPFSTTEELELMWSWFKEARRIVGFNSIGFDVPALAPLYPFGDFFKLPHFDILAKVKDSFGRRISLQAIVKESLGETKTASGGDAVEYWAKGDKESLEKLKVYCEKDVEVTMRVYDYAVLNKKLKFKDHWNELREIGVDFSYKPEVPKVEEMQMGLF